MDVFIEREHRTITIAFKGKGIDLLKALGMTPETVLLVKNDAVVPDEEFFDEEDKVTLLSVISGG